MKKIKPLTFNKETLRRLDLHHLFHPAAGALTQRATACNFSTCLLCT
jgi:hypothetical protein